MVAIIGRNKFVTPLTLVCYSLVAAKQKNLELTHSLHQIGLTKLIRNLCLVAMDL